MRREIDGVKINVVRKRIKNLYIRVNDNYEAVISVPYGVSDYEIERFYLRYSDKVKNIIKKRQSFNKCDYKIENALYIFGVRKAIEYIICDSPCANETETTLYIGTKNNLDVEKEEIIKNFLKAKLCHKINEYIGYWQNRTGLYSAGYTIRQTETRWGSCNCLTKKLNFSLYLANMPEICVSYVVLHEICHIKYNNHGAEFKAMLSYYMPQWKAVKQILNSNGEAMKFSH